ncbi:MULTISPECIES: hypothetical protein [Wolbachia]|nr:MULTISPECIES: hypothetical protein [Wolbachia]
MLATRMTPFSARSCLQITWCMTLGSHLYYIIPSKQFDKLPSKII